MLLCSSRIQRYTNIRDHSCRRALLRRDKKRAHTERNKHVVVDTKLDHRVYKKNLIIVEMFVREKIRQLIFPKYGTNRDALIVHELEK